MCSLFIFVVPSIFFDTPKKNMPHKVAEPGPDHHVAPVLPYTLYGRLAVVFLLFRRFELLVLPWPHMLLQEKSIVPSSFIWARYFMVQGLSIVAPFSRVVFVRLADVAIPWISIPYLFIFAIISVPLLFVSQPKKYGLIFSLIQFSIVAVFLILILGSLSVISRAYFYMYFSCL